MSMQETPMSERVQIGIFGLTNVGKSSLINRLTGQEMALVSEVKGTTTDPVKKSMEILPLGPVTIIDTPGFDDEGILGQERVRRMHQIMENCDIALLVTDRPKLSEDEQKLKDLILEKDIPCIMVQNKADIAAPYEGEESGGVKGNGDKSPENAGNIPYILVSAKDGTGIKELKEAIGNLKTFCKKEMRYVADLIKPGDRVVLVVPIDESAPKGRLILPQQLALRDILDAGCISLVTRPEELKYTLASLKEPPSLVITDSQAFGRVSRIVGDDIPLTSFSILMARYKGFLEQAVKGAASLDDIGAGVHILISEGCTHHRQCGDIGTVKLPAWIKKYTKCDDIEFSFTSGHAFDEELSGYDLVIHCGGCMLPDKEMEQRMKKAVAAKVPFTNYGIVIAYMNGILKRSIAPLGFVL